MKKNALNLKFVFSMLALVIACGVVSASALTPFPEPPANIELTDAQRDTVARGTPVFNKSDGAGGGRAWAVFRVNAPCDTTWSVISDLGNYTEYLKGDILESTIYKREGDFIYVKFKLNGRIAGKFNYSVKHHFPQTGGWGTWVMDAEKSNDLQSVGFWKVTPATSTTCDVTYSTALKIDAWYFGIIKGILVSQGLETATKWVKKNAEQKYSQNTEKAAPK